MSENPAENPTEMLDTNMHKQQSIDIFALEQSIMDCWAVVEDLELIKSIDNLHNIQTCLMGIKLMYNMRFEKLFKQYDFLVSKSKKQ